MPQVISSYALLTPFGDADQTWSALLDGRCLTESARVDLAAGGPHPRVTSLALQVGRDVMRQTKTSVGWHGQVPSTGSHGQIASESDTGLIVATSKGEIDTWLEYTDPRPQNAREGAGSTLVAGDVFPMGLAAIAATLVRELRISGPVLTVSAACASGLIALIRGVLMLRSGEARRILVVAAESSFHPLLLASYQRLGVLTDQVTGCRPFDRDRRGFFVGEAAAAVMLETKPTDTFSHSPGTPGECCTVDAFALGSDAVSITASDPRGLVLRNLIQRVSGGRGFDLIHAHGTGTDLNDPIELNAIDAAITGATPVYSHKGALGHTLGASSLVSVVLNCMAHGRGLIPPNSRTPNPLPTRSAIIADTPLSRPIRRSLIIAAGFGGPVAALACSRDC